MSLESGPTGSKDDPIVRDGAILTRIPGFRAQYGATGRLLIGPARSISRPVCNSDYSRTGALPACSAHTIAPLRRFPAFLPENHGLSARLSTNVKRYVGDRTVGKPAAVWYADMSEAR